MHHYHKYITYRCNSTTTTKDGERTTAVALLGHCWWIGWFAFHFHPRMKIMRGWCQGFDCFTL